MAWARAVGSEVGDRMASRWSVSSPGGANESDGTKVTPLSPLEAPLSSPEPLGSKTSARSRNTQLATRVINSKFGPPVWNRI